MGKFTLYPAAKAEYVDGKKLPSIQLLSGVLREDLNTKKSKIRDFDPKGR